MRRAAVLIGVSTTEGLPKLQAVELAIAEMRDWAIGQGIDGDRLIVLTDRNNKVHAHQIADAIDALVEQRNLDQLIVYFSGHGIYNCGDIWLLSDAPRFAHEAVNVEGSIQSARTCGISHVVIISDACRVAAEGIQALGVQGIEIFPNDPVDGFERPVDVYFACARGKPALEVRNVAEAALGYSGIYTEVLSECLVGRHPDTLEFTDEGGGAEARVPTWPLADKLLSEVPIRLKAKLGKTPPINQTPVARITSRNGWVSRLPNFQPACSDGEAVKVLGGSTQSRLNAVDAAELLLEAVLDRGLGALDDELLGGDGTEQDAGGSLLLSTASDFARVPVPLPWNIDCGIRLRGAQVRSVYGGQSECAIIDNNARLVQVTPKTGPVAVLLELDDGGGLLMPVVPGFITELRFLDGELANVSYESVRESPSKLGFADNRSYMRALRATVAAATGLGVLNLSPTISRLSPDLGIGQFDLSLSLYAAYAYHDSGERNSIRWLTHRIQQRFGFTFYDLDLLAHGAMLAPQGYPVNVLSSVPMMSRGWALLKAFGADLPPVLSELQSYLRPSLWTLFNSAGTERLVKAINEERFHL